MFGQSSSAVSQRNIKEFCGFIQHHYMNTKFLFYIEKMENILDFLGKQTFHKYDFEMTTMRMTVYQGEP